MSKPLLLTVREVSKLLRIHRPKVYLLIKDGTLRAFKLGADWRITKDSVERLMGSEIPDTFFASGRYRDYVIGR